METSYDRPAADDVVRSIGDGRREAAPGALRGLQPQRRVVDVRTRMVFGMMAVVAAGACSKRPPYGALRGDGYVALETGEQKSIDARAVRLVPDALSLDSALALICMARQRQLDALGDSAAGAAGRAVSERSWAARAQLLSRHVLRIPVAAGDSGRFAVDSIGVGKYRVWTDATVGGERWTWLEPVEVRGGDTARVALSNNNADEDPFRCQRRDIIRDAAKQEKSGSR
jgi:hypothetical protein